MPATMATVSGILKEVYEGRLNEQLDNDNVGLKRVEKTSEGTSRNIGGRFTTFAIHTRRNTGLGARQEMEALPLPGQQGAAAATVNLKHLYGACQLSGQTLELAQTDIQAFTSALDFEMDGLRNDLGKDLNRQVYGTGQGQIATIRAVVNAVIIPVDRADLFNIGDLVDVVALGPPPVVGTAGRTVMAVDLTPGANTVTLSGANIATAVGEIITRAGNGPVSAVLNREWTGFSAIVNNTGTLYGINPAVEPVWAATVDSNGGVPRAISEALMTRMADDIFSQGGKTTVIFTTLGVRRSYANLLTNQRVYSNVKDFTGGFSGIGFTTDRGEVPIVVDKSAPRGTQFFMNEDQLKLYRSSTWKFMDKDGSKWERVTGFDAYSATLFQYSELGTHRRNTHGRINDIIES